MSFGHWTEKEREKLIDLAAKGYSAAVIATHIPTKTRNAICGHIWRNNIPWALASARRSSFIRNNTLHPERKPKPPRIPKPPKPPKLVIVKPTEPEPLGPIGEIADGCKWIHGDPAIEGWRMCGHETHGSWCPFHKSRVHQKKSQKVAEDRRGHTFHRFPRAA